MSNKLQQLIYRYPDVSDFVTWVQSTIKKNNIPSLVNTPHRTTAFEMCRILNLSIEELSNAACKFNDALRILCTHQKWLHTGPRVLKFYHLLNGKPIAQAPQKLKNEILVFFILYCNKKLSKSRSIK